MARQRHLGYSATTWSTSTVDETRDRADEQRPARPRWIEATTLAVAAVAALVLLLVRGPFTSARPAAHATPPRLAVAVAPDLAPGLDLRALAPVVRHLEREASVDLELARSESALAAVEALLDDRAAIAVLPALACAQATELDHDVWLLAAQAVDGEVVTRTALVVRQGDDDAGTLRGRTLCATGTASSSGPTLLARLWLRNRELDPAVVFSATPHASHGELGALADLDARRCDVAAVSEFALRAAPAARAGRLRVMAWTGQVPQGCWASGGSLDSAIAQSVAGALIGFDPAADGLRSRVTGFVEPDSSTFRAIRLAAQLEGQLRPQLSSKIASQGAPPRPPAP
jgi:ABC-type phosphate/phosphonate transport system substrate-binding protein